MNKSSVSCTQKGPRILRFCTMPWKDEREPTIKYFLGRQVDVVQEFTTIQNCAHNWQTFYDFGNVYVFDIGSICVHGNELLRKFTFHQKYRVKSHFKADVRDIWKVDIGTIGWDFWSVSNQLWRFSMETVFSGQWWRSHHSLAREGLCILRFCVMSWKVDSEPNIK